MTKQTFFYYRGITLAGSRFVAQVLYKGLNIHLGCYKTAEEASAVYEETRAALFLEPTEPVDYLKRRVAPTPRKLSRAQLVNALKYATERTRFCAAQGILPLRPQKKPRSKPPAPPVDPQAPAGSPTVPPEGDRPS